jgi:hypothetical protein
MQVIQKILPVFLGLALVLLVVGLIQRQREIGELRSALDQMSADYNTLRRDLLEASNEVRKLQALETSGMGARQSSTEPVTDVPGSLTPIEVAGGEVNRSRGAPPERIATWRTRQLLSELEQVIAITPDQREAISEKFSKQAGAEGPPSEETTSAILTEVLGAEMFSRYQAAEVERVRKETELGLEKETVLLARRLNLSSEQESVVREALNQIETTMQVKRNMQRQLMKEAMANHFGGDEAKEALKEQYDQIKTLGDEIKSERDALLFETLSTQISDEQKNALLEYQSGK